MTDSTATSADTLKRELKKVVSEILNDGGGKNRGENDQAGFGIVKAIDEAINILTCLRKLEWKKKPESAISPVEVPKVFTCSLSNTIMIEPVIIASGQSFEKRYIKEWLKYERTCPKTIQVLSHRSWIPNHLLNKLITQWCLVNKFDRSKPSDDEIVTDLFTGDIESLLQRISSPSSVSDQTEAAKELLHKIKRFSNVRVFFVAKLPNSITRLLTPLSVLGNEVDSNPDLQEILVTTLGHISISEKNKTVIAENPHVIPVLTKSLKQGTAQTRISSVATLSSLSVIESNKIIIGNSEALKALIDLIEEGDVSATNEAAGAVFDLCSVMENRGKAVSAGLIPAVTKNIKAERYVGALLSLLALVSTHYRAVEELDKLGFIYDLLNILRNSRSLVSKENAVMTVYNICETNRSISKLKAVEEEENLHGTFTNLMYQGADRAVHKAEAILQWIERTLPVKRARRNHP